MIVSRTPFRISFCGGGTDLPTFYEEFGGCVVSTSIDKYIYISLLPSFNKNRTVLRYSKVEDVTDISNVKHPIFKEVLNSYSLGGVEISSMSSIPAGTGMGSSSAFTVGLVNAVRCYLGKETNKHLLAEEACDIEINRLNEQIGKQDQYAAAYGGLNFIEFTKEGVKVDPIKMSPDEIKKLSDNLLLFYLGGTRDANEVIKTYDNSPAANLRRQNLSKLAIKLKDELNKGDLEAMGRCLDEGWKLKKQLSGSVSNSEIDSAYDIAIDNGAVGGKLLGAGGAGFMLVYVNKDNQNSVRKGLSKYMELDFNFENTGSSIMLK